MNDIVFQSAKKLARLIRTKKVSATEVMKGGNPYALVARSQALHGLFDGLVGLS